MSLIRQLLVLRPALYQRVETIAESLTTGHPLTCCRQLWVILRYLLTIVKRSPVFILLNTVDQCVETISERVGLLTTMRALAAPLKLLLTSSKPLVLSPSVEAQHISLDEKDWAQSIAIIAASRVARIVEKRTVWRDCQQTIVDKLCSGTYTYLYVMFNLDIWEQSSIPSTRNALEERLMAPVSSTKYIFDTLVQDVHASDMAKRALNWIYHAVRPLTVSELAVALVLDSDNHLTVDMVTNTVSWDLWGDIGGALRSTVKVEGDSVLLIHQTFRNYLSESSALLIPDFHSRITEMCLSYLSAFASLGHTDSAVDPSVRVAGAFSEYANLYWTEHYKIQQHSDPQLTERVVSFLTSGSVALKARIGRGKQPIGWELDETGDRISNESDPALFALGLAIQLGLDNISAKLLGQWQTNAKKKVSKSQIDGLIITAAGADNISLLTELIEFQGPDWPGSGTNLKTASVMDSALYAATKYGCDRALELLTRRINLAKKNPGQVESTTSLEPTMNENVTKRDIVDDLLHAAVRSGNLAVTGILLSSGYDIDARDELGNTPVHVAAQLGDMDMLLKMQLLQPELFASKTGYSGPQKTRTETRNETSNDEGMSPVHMSCSSPSIEVFEMLFTEAMKSDRKLVMELLIWAARSGHLAVMERLLLADCINRDRNHSPFEILTVIGDPLHDAAERGFLDFVEGLLGEVPSSEARLDSLSTGPSQTIRDPISGSHFPRPEYFMPLFLNGGLQLAMEQGHAHVVRLLALRCKEFFPEYMQRTSIEQAVSLGDIDVLRALVEVGFSLNKDDEESGPTSEILDEAISHNHVDIVRFLLEKGIASPRDGSESSLHYAARLGHTFCVEEILRVQVASENDMLQKDMHSNTPLDLAAKSGHFAVCKELLRWRNGLAVADQSRRPGRTLLLAIKSPYQSTKPSLVRLFLDNGWSVDGSDSSSHEQPLQTAVRLGDVETVRLLLEYKANPNAKNTSNETALHLACQDSCPKTAELVNILLDEQADPNAVDSEGLTPLHVAMKNGLDVPVRTLLGLPLHESTPNDLGQSNARPLIRKLADVEKEAPGGERAVHLAYKSPAIMRILLSLNPKPNLSTTVSQSNATALICAAAGGSLLVVQQLLEAGANPKAADSNGWTTLHHVASRKSDPESVECSPQLIEEIIQTLVKQQADVNAQSHDGSTPLLVAIDKENVDTAKVLLDIDGIDVNISDNKLNSPLQLAASKKLTDVASRLIKADAKVNAKGGSFGSPLHAAVYNTSDNVRMVTLLLDAGGSPSLFVKNIGTPLHVVMNAPNYRWRLAMIQLLIGNRGANLDALDDRMRTPLLIAAAFEMEKEALVLLDSSADLLSPDLDVADETGRTAMHYSTLFDQPRFTHRLLVAGAKTDLLDGCGRSVLYCQALGFGRGDQNDHDNEIGHDNDCDESKAELPVALRQFRDIVAKLPTSTQRIHLEQAVPAALKNGASVLFNKILDVLQAESDGLVNLSVADRCGWTGLDIATHLGMEPEVQRLTQLGALKGTAMKPPSRWSMFDRECEVTISEGGDEASMVKGTSCPSVKSITIPTGVNA